MAFVFRVHDPAKPEQDRFFVKVARSITYGNARVAWMDDSRLPEWDDALGGTLAPDIDITEECHEFKSENDALHFLALHYQSELQRMSLTDATGAAR